MQFSMKTSLLALAAAQSAIAHVGFSNFFVDGVDQGDAICVRMNPDADHWNFPLQDLTSSNMACGFGGTVGVPRVCEVQDGSTLTFEFRLDPSQPAKGTIDPGHMGPCSVYMKKVDSAITDPGTGDGWFKLWDQGYDETTEGKWCTRNLVNNKGLLTINLPKGLVGGSYLVRPELLALHNANQGDPQYYGGCAQVFLKGTGSLVPASTVSIPGYVSKDDPADSFDVWAQPIAFPYPIPGPPVANFTSSGATTQSALTEGLKPSDCILENGNNFCGVEVPDYTDANSCWAAADNCWKQNDECWKTAPATGGAGCTIWSAKCTDLNNQCTNKIFPGPPNKGKDINPAKSTIVPPAPLGPTNGGNAVVAPTKVASTAASSTPAGAGATSSSAASYTTSAASSPLAAPVKLVSTTTSSSSLYYGNYSSTASEKAASTTPAAAIASTAAAPLSMPSGSYSYDHAEEFSTPAAPVNEQLSTPAAPKNVQMSTPAAAVPTAAEGVCNGGTVTVTEKDVTTVTVYPSSVDVKAVAAASAPYEVEDEGEESSSTPAAPVATLSTSTSAPVKPTHFSRHRYNSTFPAASTGYAVPSGFLKMPKYY